MKSLRIGFILIFARKTTSCHCWVDYIIGFGLGSDSSCCLLFGSLGKIFLDFIFGSDKERDILDLVNVGSDS